MIPNFVACLKEDSDFFTIRTERLELKLVCESDVMGRFEILSQYPNIADYMTFLPPNSVEMVRDHYASLQAGFEKNQAVAWSLFVDNSLSGTISIEDICEMMRSWENRSGELGYWLHPDLHGRGLMTEAMKAVMSFGFERLNLHKLNIEHFDPNIASQRVIEKCGFRLIGTRKKDLCRGGNWVDRKLYELLRPDWEKFVLEK